MQFSLVNPPKIFARNASGRKVQISGRAGEIGRFQNILVPDDQEIQHSYCLSGVLSQCPKDGQQDKILWHEQTN
jgi:hypothetical protein